MSVAAGLCAGGNYFNQPLLHSISLGLQVSEAQAALTVTLAQVSYALGLLLLVPLGDMLERGLVRPAKEPVANAWGDCRLTNVYVPVSQAKPKRRVRQA